METTQVTTAQLISVLTASPHASVHGAQREKDARSPAERLRDAYAPIGQRAVAADPNFFAHLIAWNHTKGEIRDAKAALPILQLTDRQFPIFHENALAHLADLNPKLLVKALDLGRLLHAPTHVLRRFVTRYLRDLEADRRDFDNAALQHKASLRRLYTYYHVDAAPFARAAVVEARSVEGKFGVVKQLPNMSPLEVLSAVERYKLPWLVVRGALGAKATQPEMLMAMMSRMTAADLATSAKWLLKAGVKDHPETRAAFEQLLVKAGTSRRAKGTTLKTQKAAKVLADLGEEKTAGKLQAVQERQLERTIEGNWLILGDKSGSMQETIVLAKRIAAVLARLVQGHVYLVFTDAEPKPVGDVSGKTLELIEMVTAGLQAGGATSLGCGLHYVLAQGWTVDGIALISDGAENTHPGLDAVYAEYTRVRGGRPTVYWYRTAPDADYRTPLWIREFERRMQPVGMTTIDCTHGVDDYSLPNLVQTMRVGKYALADEIRTWKLRRLDEVLPRTVGMEVLGGTTRRRVG